MYKHEFNNLDAKPIKDTVFSTVTCKLCGEAARLYSYAGAGEYLYTNGSGGWSKTETECTSPHAKKEGRKKREHLSETPGTTYRHKFEKRSIPLGEKFVVETCACGVSSKRYETGVRLYYDNSGNYSSSNNVPCTMGYTTERSSVNNNSVGRHRFVLKPIAVGDTGVIEFCPCGVESFRYKVGGRKYMVNGKWTTKTPGCGRNTPVEVEVKLKDEPISDDKNTIDTELPVVVEEIMAASTDIKILDNTDIDLSTVEKVVIVMRALYEDSVTHGMHTNSRNMAGRLLYSDEYADLIKKIQLSLQVI